jgi:uncharacterized protein YcbX
MSPTVTSIRFHPVKACSAVALERAFIGKRGLESDGVGDRRWMLIDEGGSMVSQRQIPALARVKVDVMEGRVLVSLEGREPLILTPGQIEGEQEGFSMFGRAIVGHPAPRAASEWFSAFLGRKVRLMHQTDDEVRRCDPLYAVDAEGDRVGFADAYPYLLAGEATLAKLNRMLDQPVPMNRFRPNIVIGGAEAEAEYGWREVAVGEARLALVKPCARCQVTTVDQEIGVFTGKEPLATLGRFYFFSDGRIQGAIFGENAIPLQEGWVQVGDPLTVLTAKPPHLFRA